MDLRALTKIVDGASEALQRLGLDVHAATLAAFARDLAPFGALSVEYINARLAKAAERGWSKEGPFIADVEQPLSALRAIFSATLSASKFTSVNRCLGSWRKFSDMPIRDYVSLVAECAYPDAPTPNNGEQLADAYARALTAAKHDAAEFPRIFDQLQRDQRVNKDTLIDVASAVAFHMARSTSRKTALERIWKTHAASEAFAAKVTTLRAK